VPGESNATAGSVKGLQPGTRDGENSRAENAPKIDADLKALNDAWPTLANPLKAAILALIRTT